MSQFHIPVLLLVTVAVSSSNVLPLSESQLNKELFALGDQYIDSTFNNKYQTRIDQNAISKLYIVEEKRPAFDKLQLMFSDPDNNRDILNIFNKNDNYDGEGFRKEQWHNYPRQLDRLQIYEQNSGQKNYEPEFRKQDYSEEIAPDNNVVNYNVANEFLLRSNIKTNNLYDAVISADPLLILKIRLACLNKNTDSINTHCFNLITSELKANYLDDDEKNYQIKNEKLEMNAIKVKREGIASTQDIELEGNVSTENKAVNKRIFSLWSRLQSLNHKGHELQHRRHLHAFYGLPDSDGGETLTAETRATFMRPPGSPLRWG